MAADTRLDERELVEALRTSEARFRAICEAAPLGIYVSEIEQGVIYVNPAMRRILGRRQDELLGHAWKQYLHPDDAPATLAERASNYDKHTPMRISARYVRRDGTTVWTQLHAAPIVEGDALRGYVGVLEDVSEHRELQAQLVMAGRLASVGTLAAGVAHEINSPLAVMLANLEWAQAQIQASIDACLRLGPHADCAPAANDVAGIVEGLRAIERPLHDACDAAHRVRVITKDLRLFSRPEVSEEGTACLDRVLASAARMASYELRHRARLVREYGKLPCVRGSEARLGQVFLNLLNNAAQAIPEGRPEAHEVRIRARPWAPGWVAVEVQDTGAGIDPAVLDRIFDPFFTTKAQGVGMGTGLGLAICHRIVSSHGGRIEVENNPEGGSLFRVLLRTHEGSAPQEVAVEQQSEPVSSAGARVLVIDDDPQICSSLKMILGRNHEVVTTTRAREALARLERGERYEVMLCDLMMPEMNGMEFHAALSKVLPELADQVVFLTGGAVTQEARDFLQRISNARLDKPYGLDELRRLINERSGRA